MLYVHFDHDTQLYKWQPKRRRNIALWKTRTHNWEVDLKRNKPTAKTCNLMQHITYGNTETTPSHLPIYTLTIWATWFIQMRIILLNTSSLPGIYIYLDFLKLVYIFTNCSLKSRTIYQSHKHAPTQHTSKMQLYSTHMHTLAFFLHE